MNITGTALRAIICSSVTSPAIVRELQALRRRLFVDQLGWTLQVVDECEVDTFDNLDALYCAIYEGPELKGGFRAIRCDREYLSRKVFPALATTRPFPNRRDAWEISRFGVISTDERLTRIAYAVMFRFAQLRQATALVAVADLLHERLLRRLGIRTRRYGPPGEVGVDRFGKPLYAVAGEIPLPEQSDARFHQMMALLADVEIHDETLVLGSDAISA